jgi:predicted GNAT family acetyltransferase
MAHEVRHLPERNRYEILVDGAVVGIADYYVVGEQVVFPHTEIHPSRRGQGLGAQLVQGALDDVRGTGRTVVPQCWYVEQFIDEHPDYRDLLATAT